MTLINSRCGEARLCQATRLRPPPLDRREEEIGERGVGRGRDRPAGLAPGAHRLVNQGCALGDPISPVGNRDHQEFDPTGILDHI